MYYVPKYQRAYAWEADSISDFTNDLLKCFKKRKEGNPIAHFFGGILSVEHSVPGVVNQKKYEIIDGQQRIATFTILATCLIDVSESLRLEAASQGDGHSQTLLDARIKSLQERFVGFEQEVNSALVAVRVLELSKADDPFYKSLIDKTGVGPTRQSHERLGYAFSTLRATIDELIVNLPSIADKIAELKTLETVLEADFTLLDMVTFKKEDAFRLFQVLNDRGTSLTDGDLLRAKTLEILEGFPTEQDAVERLWDEILADSTVETDSYLNWIYESYEGKRSPQNELFDSLMDTFFPQQNQNALSADDARAVLANVQQIKQDIDTCRKLVDGQWPFSNRQPITAWDRTRLSILVKELGHTLAIPLFLAATKLNHQRFSEIVQMVERSFFRYKLISNQHVSALKKIYYEEALAIRRDPAAYRLQSLKTKLGTLIAAKAPDAVFRSGLENLVYQESGASNKPLKYLLMTIEYYLEWYENGAAGAPVCVDKSRVYDFAGTSIEHVYPRNAEVAVLEVTLEPLKNTLGNLTIMDPGQNTLVGNESFVAKKPEFGRSAVKLTRQIGENAQWTSAEIDAHKNRLADIALKVFRP